MKSIKEVMHEAIILGAEKMEQNASPKEIVTAQLNHLLVNRINLYGFSDKREILEHLFIYSDKYNRNLITLL